MNHSFGKQFRRSSLALALSLFVGAAAYSQTASSQESNGTTQESSTASRAAFNYRRNVAQYNLNSGLALKGYDPVSYYRKPTGNFKMGQVAFSVDFKGARYMFSVPSSRTLFLKDPNRFEPTYGGWCAWAMSNGVKVDIDITQFSIYGRRLHFFANASAKAKFDADYVVRQGLADKEWNKFSGELPRR